MSFNFKSMYLFSEPLSFSIYLSLTSSPPLTLFHFLSASVCLCLFLYLCVSLCFSICVSLPVSLSLCLCLFLCVRIALSYSFDIMYHLRAPLSTYLPLALFFCLSVCLSVSLFILYLFPCLSLPCYLSYPPFPYFRKVPCRSLNYDRCKKKKFRASSV